MDLEVAQLHAECAKMSDDLAAAARAAHKMLLSNLLSLEVLPSAVPASFASTAAHVHMTPVKVTQQHALIGAAAAAAAATTATVAAAAGGATDENGFGDADTFEDSPDVDDNNDADAGYFSAGED